jgi:hypothetical protein
MHVLYVDESGDAGVAGSKHLVLAGAAMHEAQWRQLTAMMDSAQKTHFPQAGSTLELHASPLRAGRHEFRGVPKAQRVATLDDIYSRIGHVQRGLTLFAAVVHKADYLKQYKGRVDPYTAAFEGLCTMFNIFLQRLQSRVGRPERGIVVIDESSPALSSQLRLLLAKFQATGTRWTALTQVIETPFFFDSKTSRIMQIADFASYSVFRWYEASDDSYIKRIIHKFEHDRTKCHGLKCYPLACTRPYPPTLKKSIATAVPSANTATS